MNGAIRLVLAASLTGLTASLPAVQPADLPPMTVVSVDAATLDQVASVKAKADIARLEHDIAALRIDREYREAQLRQLIREDAHRNFVFRSQAYFGIALTIFVLLVVAAGVYLSYLQFKATVAPLEERIDASASKLSLSKEGFELSSSVIGLFVLLASMFFFYMYIKEVYPIRRAVEDAPTSRADARTREAAAAAPVDGGVSEPSPAG